MFDIFWASEFDPESIPYLKSNSAQSLHDMLDRVQGPSDRVISNSEVIEAAVIPLKYPSIE